ncbi:FAD-dependent oxidoreductase [Arthrobacter sunyaminii]|uniref:ferredoxin--NADP(+) reductase n=1 Tax=Arthrobacter sunyaminii TaxID=2816859 RepID=A0A975S6C2_9MICC|nr:FAD-dependent oxidoreductase [Arthrobacter sunyaminii]MBO0909825.1 FAD-dependent oxidoreductase [Arthrobacter sunyaminii]QWQ36615.1 FAD-dependent oxidoreductase [Arthrobacter sunyaminii]
MTALRIAVIGSGPSGAYCAQLLSEESESPIEVDVFERLAAPFGLVRYGVAPDHPRIKSIITSFTEVFDENPNVRLLANVQVGSDITLEELRNHYDAVVFASGAPADRNLGIPGETLDGVYAVREFVSWYQGHPDSAPDAFSLSGKRAVIIGVGNVALDAARMLAHTTDALRATDVPEHVVEAFAASTYDEIVVVGRRGPAYAKFTNKEFIELLEVENCDVVIDPADLELDPAQQAHADGDPAARRLLATFAKAAARGTLGRAKTIRFLFDRTPLACVGDGSVSGIQLAKTSNPTEVETLQTEVVLRSVGYRGQAIDGLPFDERTGTIPHLDSRVVDDAGHVPGVYVTGWIKRGPTGVVGTNRRCALETATSILADTTAPGWVSHGTSADEVDRLLAGRGVHVVPWAGWHELAKAEYAAGAALSRERVKLHDKDDMLRAAGLPLNLNAQMP